MSLETKKPGKKIQEICEQLGKPYCIKSFDLENVIYRDLENGYDFEISGLDNRKTNFDATIYIWQTTPQNIIVETIKNIKSLDELTKALDDLTKKYQISTQD